MKLKFYTPHNVLLLLIVVLCTTYMAQAQSPDPSAALQIDATDKGFLPPRMTETQMNAITNPADGLIIYCTDCASKGPRFYETTDAEWKEFGSTVTTTVSVTETGDANYNVLATDTIVRYTGTVAANWNLPADAPVGKVIYIIAGTGSGQISFGDVTATGASNVLGPHSGSTYVHLGGDVWAALHSF